MADDLSQEDYAALYGLMTSQDGSQRSQGQALAKKLRPNEEQAFFAYQQALNKGKDVSQRKDADVVGGIPVIGGISPEIAATVGAGAVGAGLSLAQRAAGAATSALGQAAPVIKYELVKGGLQAMGVPHPLAMAGGIAASGYRSGAKAAPAAAEEAAVATGPHMDLSTRVPAGGLTQEQIGERLKSARAQGMTAPQYTPATAPRPSPSSVPVPEGPPEASIAPEPFNAPRVKPPTPKEINEAAIAVHRSITTAAREAGVALKPGDLDALKAVVRQGTSAEDAVAALQASRDPAAELARRLGTPSDAERTFPPNKSGLPSKPPTVRKARGKIADLADMN